ncbi:hypothetical protein M9Y10_042183 [Tritrichomonas musculus]|uniref:Man1/Src1-like C-terminal domain-containing protein n=1 Tax=Tritrichomonas musculus TaxID=1915356 RepID=A0ABR2K9L6_9EUKA
MENRNKFSGLKNAPRKELINILTQNRILFDFTKDNSQLADLIISKINDPKKKFASSSFSSKVNQFCYYLLFISLFFLLSLTSILLIIYLWPKEIKFCDSSLINSTLNSKCVRCPIFAKCSGGSCICDLNYTRIKNYCIFNDKDKLNVYKMLDHAYNILKKRGGSYYCQISEIDWMSSDELEGILLKQSMLDISNFAKIYNKTLSYLIEDPFLLKHYINGNQVFVSKEIEVDIICRIKQYFYKKTIIFFIISASLIFFTIMLSVYQNSKKRKQIATRYSAVLIKRLKDKRGTQQSKSQLIYHLNSVSDNNGKELWPIVKKELEKSEHVQHYNDGYSSNFRYIP